jgi:hemoglobin
MGAFGSTVAGPDMADDKVGGVDAVKAAVGDFYDRVTNDPELAGWFTGVDMRRLRTHQTAFLLFALGGQESYIGRPLHQAHAGLQITDTAFDATVAHLLLALEGVGMGKDVIGQLKTRLDRMRSQIVGA